ncbi:VanZ family protein [Halobacillus sp. A5]|uniref:VanZ family protein n=1 Tax=Halobacillus sp. A5 TaxID=2880263 RepID=UPI0020A64CA9|nr:VanZ family protein [Halobacillus sp. A5]MCP3028069.1 VanZ family protein [Halobacillus sp. A5]
MRKLVYWLPVMLWMTIIYYSSSTPYEKQNIKPLLGSWFDLSWLEPYLNRVSFTYNTKEVSAAALGVEGFIEFFIRKGAHLGVFFVLTLLFYYAFSHSLQGRKFLILVVASWTGAVLYAVFDEWHQGLTPNRTPYAGDVILDAAGGGLAVIVIFIVVRRRTKKHV